MASTTASSAFELTLGLKLSYVPKSLTNLIKDLSNSESDEVKLLVLNDHLLKYQDELIFAAVFKQELPQCRLLLMDAMETLKEEIKKIKMGMGLEVDRSPAAQDVIATTTTKHRDFEEKGSLLDLNSPSSVQWSNPTHHHDNRQASLFDPRPRVEQFPMDDHLNLKAKNGSLNCELKPLTQPIWRNNRRSWTPELHARFVLVLHLLGGHEVATPKQIRDHMQVEGLTTNQVKSHLQKYRLNWRSSPSNTADDYPPKKSKLYCSDLPTACFTMEATHH